MATSLKAFIYGSTKGAYAQGTYKVQGFPTSLITIEPVPSGVSPQAGVTVLSAITLLPTGLNQPSISFYTDTAVDTLITAANT